MDTPETLTAVQVIESPVFAVPVLDERDSGWPDRIERDNSIVQGRAEGKIFSDLAKENGCSIGTAHDVVQRNLDRIEALKRVAVEKLSESWTGTLRNMAAVSQCFAHKQSVNAAKWMTEFIFGWGAKHNIHIGDVNNTQSLTLHVDAGSLARDANLRDTLRESLGLRE